MIESSDFSAPAFARIHADESCLGNQFRGRDRPGGAAALLELWRGDAWDRRDVWLSEPSTTNNRMALKSALLALESLPETSRVHFHSDSTYLVQGCSSWLASWKKRGWKRKGGRIQNLELWQELDQAISNRRIRWLWVKGHAGDPRNEYVDRLARRAAKEQTASPIPMPSFFRAWLAKQQDQGLYRNFDLAAPPS